MVHQKTRRSKSIISQIGIFAILLAILMIALGTIIGVSTKTLFGDNNDQVTDGVEQTLTTAPAEPQYQVIDFQPIVDEWAESISGNRSVLIYDLENNQIVGEYNADEFYNTASLYKLFIVYEGYRRLENNEWQEDTLVGNTGHTILECLDIAIRESNSPCAESLLSIIGQTELDEIIIKDFNIKNTDVANLSSNPRDILAIMKIFYDHPDIKNTAYLEQIKDSFLNQPVTTYNWRQGLPSGFSKANVYDKVGWDYNPAGYWNIYHDAAIVEFSDQNRHYIVIVMTNYVPFESIAKLGTSIEEYFNKY